MGTFVKAGYWATGVLMLCDPCVLCGSISPSGRGERPEGWTTNGAPFAHRWGAYPLWEFYLDLGGDEPQRTQGTQRGIGWGLL